MTVYQWPAGCAGHWPGGRRVLAHRQFDPAVPVHGPGWRLVYEDAEGLIFRRVSTSTGAVAVELTGGALARLEAITPPGMVAQIDVSLTDEPPIAHAIVIITALPRNAA